MERRSASIAANVNSDEFKCAVAAHLSTAVTALMVTDPDYDPWITDVRLWVDDMPKDFTIVHVITSTNRVSGVILLHTTEPHGDHDDAEFVVIRFDKHTSATIHPEVLVTKERHWLQNKGLVLHQLTNYVYLS